MSIKERINEVFEKFNIGLKAEETALETQAVLENGTIIYTDSDSFEEGGDVYIVNEEGERIPLPQGDYTLADGALLVVAEGGKIGKAPARADGKEGSEGEGKVAKGNPAKVKAPVAKEAPKKKAPKSKKSKDEKNEDMAEHPLDEAAVIALINQILDERFPAEEVVEEEATDEVVEEEELSTEEPTEEVELEMELTLETLKEQLSAQAEELITLKAEAASEGVKRAVPTAKQVEAVDLTSLSTEERIKALFNQFNA